MMGYSATRCHRLSLITTALVGVALLGCHSVPSNGSHATSADYPVPAPPWPEDQVLACLSRVLAEESPAIDSATGLICFDCGGVGLRFVGSPEEGAATASVVVSSRFGPGPADNEISVQGYERSAGKSVTRWRDCPVVVGSALEVKLVELAERVATSAAEPTERYNATQLLAVLRDRKYDCKWRRFWYGHETYGEGYGARYREKYGDEAE